MTESSIIMKLSTLSGLVGISPATQTAIDTYHASLAATVPGPPAAIDNETATFAGIEAARSSRQTEKLRAGKALTAAARVRKTLLATLAGELSVAMQDAAVAVGVARNVAINRLQGAGEGVETMPAWDHNRTDAAKQFDVIVRATPEYGNAKAHSAQVKDSAERVNRWANDVDGVVTL